jgi:hypothetical protein
MQSLSRQASPVFQAASRASLALPRLCARCSATSHVRSIQTARRAFFGAASICNKASALRRTGNDAGKARTHLADTDLGLRSEADHGSLTPMICCAGASYLPAMAFFGATATKDSLYEYTVKDAGAFLVFKLSPFHTVLCLEWEHLVSVAHAWMCFMQTERM